MTDLFADLRPLVYPIHLGIVTVYLDYLPIWHVWILYRPLRSILQDVSINIDKFSASICCETVELKEEKTAANKTF
jgi:hypothetical protein